MTIIDGIPVFGEPDEGALRQIKRCATDAVHVALMADHHLGYAVPIGGVVAYRGSVSPSGVGFDIGCGNKAVRLDIPASEVRANIKTIMDDIWTTISFGINRNNPEPVEHPLFDKDYPGWQLPAINSLKRMAANQLGTVGSGNHYIDILEDENQDVWIGVHFGSRGFGHKTATYFLKEAGAKDGIDVDPCILPVQSQIGEDYLAAMQLAGEYAYAGRDWVCARVAKLLGANILEEVHNHHNFAWKEAHSLSGGMTHYETLWVVRKGATPAFPGQRGFIGGSMGDISVIVEGVVSELGQHTLYSTIHGAGRAMGRMEAKGKPSKPGRMQKHNNGTQTWIEPNPGRPGKVTRDMMATWIKDYGVELRGGDVDESPHCYKRIEQVLEHHKETIQVLHTLRPLGVAMAAKGTLDPYKD